MKNTGALTIISLLVALVAIGHSVWLHTRVETLAYEAVRKREQELVRDMTPTMQRVYEGFGVKERIPENPSTLQELFAPISRMSESLRNTPTFSAEPKTVRPRQTGEPDGPANGSQPIRPE